MNRPWSHVHPVPASDPLDIALREIEAAIVLVRRGQARRVRLIGLEGGERAAGLGLARAQAAGVRFAMEREAEPGLTVSLIVGPAFDEGSFASEGRAATR